jgi:glucose/arabinose dehydrogenase
MESNMMRKFVCASLFTMALGGAAHAGQCSEKQALNEELNRRFGESEFATALSETNAVKFYRNPTSQTWSVVVVMPNGVACLVAAGESLEIAANQPTRPSRAM